MGNNYIQQIKQMDYHFGVTIQSYKEFTWITTVPINLFKETRTWNDMKYYWIQTMQRRANIYFGTFSLANSIYIGTGKVPVKGKNRKTQHP